MRNKYVFLLLTVFFMPLIAAALECAVCGADIRGEYIKTAKADYCSRECYHSTLPNCENCGEPCLEQSVEMMNRKFCSRRCMHMVFKCSVCRRGLNRVFTMKNQIGTTAYYCQNCRNLPGCYFCSMPTGAKKEADGRRVCPKCRKTAVNDPREVARLFKKVRMDLNKMFGYDSRHYIRLSVVDVETLNKEAGSVYLPAGGRRMALMRYQNQERFRKLPNGKVERQVFNEKCQIFVLRGVPRDMLYDAFAHELTHDHIRHNVGNVRELANEEGFCELIASLYNQKLGNSYLNAGKERNPDPVYGGGYRKMRKIYRRTKSFRKTLKAVK